MALDYLQQHTVLKSRLICGTWSACYKRLPRNGWVPPSSLGSSGQGDVPFQNNQEMPGHLAVAETLIAKGTERGPLKPGHLRLVHSGQKGQACSALA